MGVPESLCQCQLPFTNRPTTHRIVCSPLISSMSAKPSWTQRQVRSPIFSLSTFTQIPLDQPDVTASVASASTPSSTGAGSTSRPAPTHHTNVGAITGGVVGGIVGLGLIIAVVLFFLNKRKKSRPPPTLASSAMSMRTYDTYQNPPLTGKLYVSLFENIR